MATLGSSLFHTVRFFNGNGNGLGKNRKRRDKKQFFILVIHTIRFNQRTNNPPVR
jgi:hypothetical protein